MVSQRGIDGDVGKMGFDEGSYILESFDDRSCAEILTFEMRRGIAEKEITIRDHINLSCYTEEL